MTRLTDRKVRGARLRVEHFVGAGNGQGTRVSLKHREQNTGVMIDPVIDSENP